MKVTLTSPHANVLDVEGRAANVDLGQLAGKRLSEGTADRYLDTELADLGLIGGIFYVANARRNDVDIGVDFWSPQRLDRCELELLVSFTTGQLADGVGENGFEVSIGKQTLVIYSSRQPLIVEQRDDQVTDAIRTL